MRILLYAPVVAVLGMGVLALWYLGVDLCRAILRRKSNTYWDEVHPYDTEVR